MLSVRAIGTLARNHAARNGLKTALVLRPLEYGKGRHPDLTPEPAFDVNAASFIDLADQLGV